MRLSALGLIGGALLASAVSVAPVSAQSASISGSVTFITPAGFTSTISAESVLPSGFVFNTAPAVLTPADPFAGTSATLSNSQVLVAPAYNLLGFSIAATSLSVGSSVAPTAVTSSASFTAAAASILTNSAKATVGLSGATVLDGLGNVVYNSANIDFISAIISAGAGVSGLD